MGPQTVGPSAASDGAMAAAPAFETAHGAHPYSLSQEILGAKTQSAFVVQVVSACAMIAYARSLASVNRSVQVRGPPSAPTVIFEGVRHTPSEHVAAAPRNAQSLAVVQGSTQLVSSVGLAPQTVAAVFRSAQTASFENLLQSVVPVHAPVQSPHQQTNPASQSEFALHEVSQWVSLSGSVTVAAQPRATASVVKPVSRARPSAFITSPQ
jgi:hypothetical protein